DWNRPLHFIDSAWKLNLDRAVRILAQSSIHLQRSLLGSQIMLIKEHKDAGTLPQLKDDQLTAFKNRGAPVILSLNYNDYFDAMVLLRSEAEIFKTDAYTFLTPEELWERYGQQ
ncbi:MAG TPA: hypothetical protein VEF04_14260, partial [Blastocatellia bacterium]|nr:hypothetical protein [Blastocatellia bacterium]